MITIIHDSISKHHRHRACARKLMLHTPPLHSVMQMRHKAFRSGCLQAPGIFGRLGSCDESMQRAFGFGMRS